MKEIEAEQNHVIKRKKRTWMDYSIKSLAFWVVLALIGGVIFGSFLFNEDKNPKSVLRSVVLFDKKVKSGNLNPEFIWELNRQISNQNISKAELEEYALKDTDSHVVYSYFLELDSKIAERNLLDAEIKTFKDKDLTADETTKQEAVKAKRASVGKELSSIRAKIRAVTISPEELKELNKKIQSDPFAKELQTLQNTIQSEGAGSTAAVALQAKIDQDKSQAKLIHEEVGQKKSTSQKGIQYFIKILKWLVGPIIFLTIILGIVGLDSLKELGSIGLKAFIYFEIVSTLALAIGVLFGNFLAPGKGMNIDPTKLDSSKVEKYVESAAQNEDKSIMLQILKDAIPSDPITPFLNGKTIQVLVMALTLAILIAIFGGKYRKRILKPLEIGQNFFFKILLIVMWLSPIATFCAMAYLIGEFGISSLIGMGKLLLVMLLSCLVFIFVILGSIMSYFKLSIFKFMRYIYKEILIVFATSSSESALAPLMKRLEAAGVNKSVTGLVIPTGYSFNLDCTNIYLSLSIIFLAQAINVDLSIFEQLGIILILMITSKGAVGVTGSGFIVLAGTLGAMGSIIPVVVVTILLGIDKFMSELRAVGNLCGNAVACVIVALWDKKIDLEKFKYTLDNPDSVHGVL